MSELPEFASSRLARERAAAAMDGELTLQRCRNCSKTQYPCREVCQYCLSDGLEWTRVDRSGIVLATARVHASLHPYFRERAPWQICSVVLDAGPRVIAHAQSETIESGDAVQVFDERIGAAHCVLIAESKA